MIKYPTRATVKILDFSMGTNYFSIIITISLSINWFGKIGMYQNTTNFSIASRRQNKSTVKISAR
jgi:hypothetical protein